MTSRRQGVLIPAGRVTLPGALAVPPDPIGLVLFAHGSGSSRFSSRNNFVAEVLRKRGIATLLFDLLTEEEDCAYANRFDIELITERLVQATAWTAGEKNLGGFRLGYFGSSTGSAAALFAAARRPENLAAVVSRGGRPDLAAEALARVAAPTLLIVGGRDEPVLGMNESALGMLACEKKLEIVPGAAHLFEEPGTLEKAAGLAADWFVRWMC